MKNIFLKFITVGVIPVLPAPLTSGIDDDAFYRALLNAFAQAMNANGMNTFSFSGDQIIISRDTSPFREGSWSLVSSGGLFTLAGDLVMKYWSHNTALDANGNFLPRDDAGPCAIECFTEGIGIGYPLYLIFGAPTGSAGTAPVFNTSYSYALNTGTGQLYANNLGMNQRSIVGASDTMLVSDGSLLFNFAGTVTETLIPAATGNKGQIVTLTTVTANAVVSASSNVLPITGGAAGTAILAATSGKWADLQSNGTNWQIIRSN